MSNSFALMWRRPEVGLPTRIRRSASAIYADMRKHTIEVLRTATVGAGVLVVLYGATRLASNAVDSFVFLNVSSEMRRVLLDYRIWELYRACLYFIGAATTGYLMTRVDEVHGLCAAVVLTAFVSVVLLASLFTSPEGFYLTDVAIALIVGVSPAIGAIASGKRGHEHYF